MSFIENFEPQALWKHFDHILTIYRPSKGEEHARAYVEQVADDLGLAYKIDPAGNIVVSKRATPGKEEAPITILQSHLDMVLEKNSDVDHDFATDPIRPQQDGEYLTATGTTLGSDNGIGVAAMLALMAPVEFAHGPLEFLFTIDEETGLTGASSLADDMLEGRQLINLDSEEEGSLCVGCAGGADSGLTLSIEKNAPAEGAAAQTVRVSGFKGGHSGVDIHLQRANAVKILVRCLIAAQPKAPFALADIDGGNAHNAIPREAHATVTLAPGDVEAFRDAVGREFAAAAAEYRTVEPTMTHEVADAELPGEVWSEDSTGTALRLIEGLPHGIVTMSYDIQGLVETSTNLATVKPQNGSLGIGLSSRSSVATALSALRQRIRSTAGLAGAEVSEGNGYPGWQPDMDSRLLHVVRELHERVLGSEPEVGAIHAGLECGIIGEKYDGMDMISFGPQIEFPHSPDERVHIASVGRFWKLLAATLEELAG
jgi:dipeptidase D